MPKVSIIVPVYNAEKYLGWCINSILNQSFRDIELLLVDDGSTDGSQQICQNYAELDKRVRVIEKENGGVSSARNLGMENAQGEYIQFVDSDDVIAPHMTERLLEAAVLYSADIVFCGICIVDRQKPEKISFNELSSACVGEECVFDKEIFWEKLPYFFWETSIMEGPCNRIYRSSVMRENALRFPEDMSYGEDFVFNLEYYNKINTSVFLNELLYYYIWNEEDSLARSYKENLFQNQMRQIKLLFEFIENNGKMTKEGKAYLANYCASQTIKSIEMLFDPIFVLPEKEKKRKLAEVVQDKCVQESFPNAAYIPEKYEPLKAAVMRYDIGRILEFFENFGKPPVIEPSPGISNRFFVGFFRLVQKVFKKGSVNKWAHIIELNLMTVGLLTTLKRVWGKIKKQSFRSVSA